MTISLHDEHHCVLVFDLSGRHRMKRSLFSILRQIFAKLFLTVLSRVVLSVENTYGEFYLNLQLLV